MSLEVTYKGSQIAQLTQDGSLTLETAGKYCEDDIGLTYAGGSSHVKEVPNGFTQLLALRSSGTQCINTGVVANLETKAEVDYNQRPGSIGGAYMYIFGAPTFYFLSTDGVSINADIVHLYSGFGNVADKTGGSTVLYARKTVTINKTAVTIDFQGTSASIALGATRFSNSNPLCIFGRRDGSDYERFSFADIYRVKIWDNGTLVRHMVPCMRDADSVLGMYDLCESTCPETNSPFYINVANGTFVGVDYD